VEEAGAANDELVEHGRRRQMVAEMRSEPIDFTPHHIYRLTKKEYLIALINTK
jgi:hypothetical protein